MDARTVRVEDHMHYGLSGRGVEGKHEPVCGGDAGGEGVAFKG